MRYDIDLLNKKKKVTKTIITEGIEIGLIARLSPGPTLIPQRVFRKVTLP